MEGTAAAAAVAHKRLKRAMGLMRQAAAALAPELDVEVLGEVHLEAGDDAGRVLELVRLARQHRPAIDVVIVASTSVNARGRERQPEVKGAAAAPHHGAPRGA